jgi:hypothetical protein
MSESAEVVQTSGGWSDTALDTCSMLQAPCEREVYSWGRAWLCCRKQALLLIHANSLQKTTGQALLPPCLHAWRHVWRVLEGIVQVPMTMQHQPDGRP